MGAVGVCCLYDCLTVDTVFCGNYFVLSVTPNYPLRDIVIPHQLEKSHLQSFQYQVWLGSMTVSSSRRVNCSRCHTIKCSNLLPVLGLGHLNVLYLSL